MPQAPDVHRISQTQDLVGSRAANRRGFSLLCGFYRGSSPLNFSWTVNGNKLESGKDDVFISPNNGKLTVSDVSEGLYQCIISNINGTAIATPIAVKFSGKI